MVFEFDNNSNKVLEIGTGSGYQAAILSHLAHEVYSVERIPELTASAKKLFEHLEYDNIKTKISDGYDGWSENAPYDRIIVTAICLLYTSPSPRDGLLSRMPSSA